MAMLDVHVTDGKEKKLVEALYRMESFEEQFKAMIAEYEKLAISNQNCLAEEVDDFTAGFKAGISNEANVIVCDLQIFFRDFQDIKKRLSDAVASESKSTNQKTRDIRLAGVVRSFKADDSN